MLEFILLIRIFNVVIANTLMSLHLTRRVVVNLTIWAITIIADLPRISMISRRIRTGPFGKKSMVQGGPVNRFL